MRSIIRAFTGVIVAVLYLPLLFPLTLVKYLRARLGAYRQNRVV